MTWPYFPPDHTRTLSPKNMWGAEPFSHWPRSPFPSSEPETCGLSRAWGEDGSRCLGDLLRQLLMSLSSTLPLAVTALLFKMEEANLASRAKAQELIQATNQVGPSGEESPRSLFSSPDSD